MLFRQYQILSGVICGLLFICAVKADLVIGDFETADSFKQSWRAKRGVWGATWKIKRTQLNSTSGRHALEAEIKGSKKNTWPYLEYRFPKDQQDLSKYKIMRLDIFNATKKTSRIQGFFSMLSSQDKDKCVRVYFSCVLQPGANVLKIKLKAKRGNWEKNAKVYLPVNWKNVDRVQLFFNCPRKDIKLFIDSISLIASSSLSDNDKIAVPKSKVSSVKSMSLRKKIKLDGKLTKKEWSSVPKHVISLQNNGKSAREKTFLQVAYDSSNLYLGILCRLNDVAQLKAPARKNDGNLWNDDNIEIFLQNRSEGENTYYQLAFNAAGSQYDAKVVNGLSVPSWDRPWQVYSFRGDKFWSSEVVIPWRVFHFPSSRAPQWSLNIFRYNSTTKEASALSPTYGGYHVSKKFLPLELSAPDLKEYSLNIENFDLKEMTLGTNHCQLTVNARCQDKFSFELQLQDIDNRNKRVVRIKSPLVVGISKINIPFEQKGLKPLKAKVVIRNSKNIPIAETSQARARMEPVIGMKIMSPSYRNTIYSEQKNIEIEASLKINVQKELYNELSIIACLKNSKAEILDKKKLPAAPSAVIKFPSAALSQGAYSLEALLVDKNGKVIAKKEQVVHILPHQAGQVTVGKDNFLRIDNKPFFPILLYSPSYLHLDMLKKIGFNTAYSYVGWKAPEEERKQLDKYGNKGFYTIASIAVSILQSHKRTATFKQTKPKLAKWVNELKKSKKLLAYEILDEPNILRKSHYSPYLQAYNYIKQLDPYHPMLLVQCGEIHMPVEHAEFTDIYEFDYYPGFKLNGDSLQPLCATALRVRTLRKKLNDSRPVWPLFQGYDRMREWDKFNTGRISNYLETRSLFYSSIAEGATGLGFWCYNHGHFGCMAGRRNWLGIVKNVEELQQLMPVIIAPSITRKLRCSAPDNNKFHYIVKNYKGYFYIIAASTSEKNVSVNFAGELLKNTNELKILGENRIVKVAESKFVDNFDRYQVHIYTNDPNPVKIADIAGNQQECLAYIQKIKDRNKNNILHQIFLKEKYTIKVKSPEPFRNDYFILDGLRNSTWFRSAKKLPANLSVNLERPLKINRIAILSSSDYIMKSLKGVIRDFTVQIKVNNKWENVRTVSNNEKLKVEIKFATQTVSAIRLIINKTNGTKVSIDELEAYCD